MLVCARVFVCLFVRFIISCENANCLEILDSILQTLAQRWNIPFVYFSVRHEESFGNCIKLHDLRINSLFMWDVRQT